VGVLVDTGFSKVVLAVAVASVVVPPLLRLRDRLRADATG
jgi:hypothetical protein